MGTDPEGTTTLYYDGALGKLVVDPEIPSSNSYDIPGESGRRECSCNFEDKNQGPMPPGMYSISSDELSDPGYIGDILRNFRGDWGDWRVPAHPNQGTDTHGRGGFYVHGGTLPGSAGCIDVGGGLHGNADTDRLKNDIMSDPDGRVILKVMGR
jgi:hypothetical protein